MTAFHYRTQANEVNWGFTMLVVTRAGNLIEWLYTCQLFLRYKREIFILGGLDF